jgi:hypothetical protein
VPAGRACGPCHPLNVGLFEGSSQADSAGRIAERHIVKARHASRNGGADIPRRGGAGSGIARKQAIKRRSPWFRTSRVQRRAPPAPWGPGVAPERKMRHKWLARSGPRFLRTRSSQPFVEPRGLEPLTPTLPVWCATSCATAPNRTRCPGHSRNITHAPPRGHLPGVGLVEEDIRREVGDRRQDAALAAEDHRPQVVWAVDEGVTRKCVEDEPRAARDLFFQLARRPA